MPVVKKLVVQPRLSYLFSVVRFYFVVKPGYESLVLKKFGFCGYLTSGILCILHLGLCHELYYLELREFRSCNVNYFNGRMKKDVVICLKKEHDSYRTRF